MKVVYFVNTSRPEGTRAKIWLLCFSSKSYEDLLIGSRESKSNANVGLRSFPVLLQPSSCIEASLPLSVPSLEKKPRFTDS